MKNGQESAFPIVYGSQDDHVYPGLTKREYFAGLAMQGIMADGETSDIPSIASASIMVAEELLKQLDKTTLTP